MKQIILLSIIFFSILGCGLMNNPKENDEQIHVPQDITIETPKILKLDDNKNQVQKHQKYSRWYN